MKKETLSEIPLSPDLRKTKMGKEEPADVEMKDAESPAAENEEPKKDADLLTLEGKNQINLNIYHTSLELSHGKCVS